MDIRKLTNILLGAGVCLLVIALVWWNSFYGEIMKNLDARLSDALGCLYSSAGACGMASGIATFLGKSPYHPELFWAGMIILLIGIVMKASLRS
jgi:hypothetical protein